MCHHVRFIAIIVTISVFNLLIVVIAWCNESNEMSM